MSGSEITIRYFDWLKDLKLSENVYESMVDFSIKHQVDLLQLFHYFKNERKGQTMNQIWNTHKDYCSMGDRLDFDFSHLHLLMPHELIKRHNQLVDRINELNAIEAKKREEEQARSDAEQYEYYSRLLGESAQWMTPAYAYQEDELMVVVPQSVEEFRKESDMLSHCVGSTYTYINRHCEGNSHIFFIRKADDPETPLYTLELSKNNGIKQFSTFGNQKPPEEAKTFVQRWIEKVVKQVNAPKENKAIASAVAS
jgi:hypothetical protein